MMIEYELFFNYSLDMFVIAGMDGYFKRANPAFCNMLGYHESTLLSRPYLDFVHPDDVDTVIGAVKNLTSGHPAFLVKVRLRAVDGTYHPLEWTAYPDLEAGLLFAIARDYSRVYFKHEQLKMLIDSSPTAIFLIEENGAISYCNRLAEVIFEYKKSELIGHPTEILIPEKYQKRHLRDRERYMTSPSLRPMGTLPDLVGRRHSGDEFPIDVGLNPVQVDRSTVIICSVIDLSLKSDFLNTLLSEKHKLEKENNRLARLANHDTLTGLYNRRAFERTLHHSLVEARKYKETLSILLADIDHFKQYNDTFGHLSGDETLKHLAEVLSNNIRKEDSAARIGGEEFVIVLPGIEYSQALRFGERLRRVIQEDPKAPHPITVSMGVTTYEFKSKQTAIKQIQQQVIHEADLAMYHSKNTGRNKITHFLDLDEE